MNHRDDLDPLALTLERILAVTPAPPDLLAEPEEVQSAVEVITRSRAELLNHLSVERRATPVISVEARLRYQELRDRDARWCAAVDRARQEIAGRLAAMQRYKKAL